MIAIALPTENKSLPEPRTRKPAKKIASPEPATIRSGGLRIGAPVPAPVVKAKKEPKPKMKIDPKFVRAARELRDRYLERVNEGPMLMGRGKYDVSRAMGKALPAEQMRLLPAA